MMVDYKFIEDLLVRLLTLLADVFSESEVNEVQEFIDAGEYGLALDTLIDIINEESKIVPRDVVEVARETAAAMALDSVDVELRLSRFATKR